jgi:hypothetical protein
VARYDHDAGSEHTGGPSYYLADIGHSFGVGFVPGGEIVKHLSPYCDHRRIGKPETNPLVLSSLGCFLCQARDSTRLFTPAWALLLALVFSLYSSRKLGPRISELTRLCSQIAMVRLNDRSRICTYCESDDLIDAFNTMGEELCEQARNTVQQTMEELSASRDKRESNV